MSDIFSMPSTAFAGLRKLAQGPLIDVALAVKAAAARSPETQFLTFNDTTGEVIDLDLRGTTAEIVARLTARRKKQVVSTAKPSKGETAGAPVGPGRPKLGVVAREVTLLPRHWDWLAAQSGGASNALRRLVEVAIRSDGGRSAARAAQEACHRFSTAMAGDLPEFEEAMRVLFTGDVEAFAKRTEKWPEDVRAYARHLAVGADLASKRREP